MCPKLMLPAHYAQSQLKAIFNINLCYVFFWCHYVLLQSMLAKGIVTIIHWLLIQLCFLHIHKLHMNDNKVCRVLISLKSHCCHLFLLLDLFPQTSYKSTNASSSTNTELFSEGCSQSGYENLRVKSPLATKLGLSFISVFLLF